jgi:hypothetical protein
VPVLNLQALVREVVGQDTLTSPRLPVGDHVDYHGMCQQSVGRDEAYIAPAICNNGDLIESHRTGAECIQDGLNPPVYRTRWPLRNCSAVLLYRFSRDSSCTEGNPDGSILIKTLYPLNHCFLTSDTQLVHVTLYPFSDCVYSAHAASTGSGCASKESDVLGLAHGFWRKSAAPLVTTVQGLCIVCPSAVGHG